MKRGFLCLILIFLIACTTEKVDTGNIQDNPFAQIIKQKSEQKIEQPTNIIVQEKQEEKYHTNKIAEIIKKSEDISNYRYEYDALVRNNYGSFENEHYSIVLKNEKVKKTYLRALELEKNDIWYNEIYLDLNEQTASAICSTKSVVCESKIQIFDIDYTDEIPKFFPLDLLKNLPYDTKIVGEEVIDRRKTTVVKYLNNEKKFVKISIDNFYGVPMKQVIYTFKDDEEYILAKYLFVNLDVGNVKNKEVKLPEEYVS